MFTLVSIIVAGKKFFSLLVISELFGVKKIHKSKHSEQFNDF